MFRFSNRALADLDSIVEYTIRTWDEVQAARYLAQLETACQRLAEIPALGRRCENIRRRDGLGYGPVLQRDEWLIGGGFLDAYYTGEKRDEMTQHICAIQISRAFLAAMPRTAFSFKLLCFYRGTFFLHPHGLIDDTGKFDDERILALLRSAGANKEKLLATEQFLAELEDYEAAMLPDSRTSQFLRNRGFDPGTGGESI